MTTYVGLDAATQPKRIQLRRTKGWRKPEGAIVVSRPSRWGNPWRVYMVRPRVWRLDGPRPISFWWQCKEFAAAAAVHEFGRDLRAELLGGHDLACWCPHDQPCHADVLLELANAEVSR